MGFFKKIGEWMDKGISAVWGAIVRLTKRLANLIATSIRTVAQVLGKFFTLLTKWIGEALKYVEATFNIIVAGAQTFLKKVGDEYQELSYNYSRQKDGSYIKNTVVRQTFVSESEIPDDILAKARQMEQGNLLDISEATATRQEQACNQLSA